VFGKHIQELSFFYNSSSEQSESGLPDEYKVTRILPNLKRVTLADMRITCTQHMGRALLDSLDVSTLTHLSMLNCQRGKDFATGLGLRAREHEIDLEHIALDLGRLKEDEEGSV